MFRNENQKSLFVNLKFYSSKLNTEHIVNCKLSLVFSREDFHRRTLARWRRRETNASDLGAKGGCSFYGRAGGDCWPPYLESGGSSTTSSTCSTQAPDFTPPLPPPMLLTIPHLSFINLRLLLPGHLLALDSTRCPDLNFSVEKASEIGRNRLNSSTCVSFSGHSDRNRPPLRFVIRDVLFGQKSDVF